MYMEMHFWVIINSNVLFCIFVLYLFCQVNGKSFAKLSFSEYAILSSLLRQKSRATSRRNLRRLQYLVGINQSIAALIYYDNFPFTSKTFGTSANLILFRNTCQYFEQSFRNIKCNLEHLFSEIKTKSVNIQIKCIFRLRIVVLLRKCPKKSQMGQVGSVYETCQ